MTNPYEPQYAPSPLLSTGVSDNFRLAEKGGRSRDTVVGFIKTAGEVALMEQAALETNPSQLGVELIVDPDKAAAVASDYAFKIIADNASRKYYSDEEKPIKPIPSGYAATARKAIANGGAVLRLTSHSGSAPIGNFWDRVEHARAQQASKPIEAQA